MAKNINARSQMRREEEEEKRRFQRGKTGEKKKSHFVRPFAIFASV
jgi:hypothetical protein